MIYFILLLVLFICIYRYDYCQRRQFRSLAFWGLLIAFILVAGLRYRLGVDSIRYEHAFVDFPKLTELGKFNFSSTRYEPGFIVFASITRQFTKDFTYMQLLEAALVNGVVFWFAYKNTRHVFLFLTLYLIFFYLNFNYQIMREALAICIFLLSWPLIKKGNWILYYVMTALALCCHTSAIFMVILPLFFVPGIRNIFKYGPWMYVVILLLVAAGFTLRHYFFNFFQLLTLSDRLVDRAKMYASDVQGGMIVNVFGVIGIVIRNMLYPLIALYFKKSEWNFNNRARRIKERRPEWWKWEIMVVVGIYVAAMSIPINIMGRYLNYFGLFLMLAISDWAFSKVKRSGKTYKINATYWYLFLAPLFIYQLSSYNSPAANGSTKNYIQFYPYSSRLNPTENSEREKFYKWERAR